MWCHIFQDVPPCSQRPQQKLLEMLSTIHFGQKKCTHQSCTPYSRSLKPVNLAALTAAPLSKTVTRLQNAKGNSASGAKDACSALHLCLSEKMLHLLLHPFWLVLCRIQGWRGGVLWSPLVVHKYLLHRSKNLTIPRSSWSHHLCWGQKNKQQELLKFQRQ